MNPRYPLVATSHLAAQAKAVIWPVLDPYQGRLISLPLFLYLIIVDSLIYAELTNAIYPVSIA